MPGNYFPHINPVTPELSLNQSPLVCLALLRVLFLWLVCHSVLNLVFISKD